MPDAAPDAQAPPPAPNFDVAGARAAGASDAQIATFLAPRQGFDLAAAHAAGASDGQIADFLAARPVASAPVPPPQTSASGAFLHAVAEETLPATGGMGAAGMGAATGAAIGAAIPGLGETGIPEVVGGLVGGVAGYYAGAKATGAAQQAAIAGLPPDVQHAIGEAPEQQQARAAQHPYASMLGGLAPNLAFLRPGAVEQAAENAPAIAKFMANPITAGVFGAGVNTALEAAQEGQQGQGYDPAKLAIAAGAGALMTRETALGRTVSGAGAAAATRIGTLVSPRPLPAGSPPADLNAGAAAVLTAPNVDDSIAAAEDLAQRQTPIDVGHVAGELDQGAPADQQQAKLLRMFDGLGTGTVENDGSGGYQFRTTGADGEATHPIEPWDPDAPHDAAAEDAQPTIPPDTAHAIADHYAAAGIHTVFYRDDPAMQFDGTFDPKQPDTIFVSNNPVRAAAQVAGHEFTHALADTTLPDGTSVGDLLNRQIAAGLTPEGQRYAAATFSATAPKRGLFAPGPEGDAAHAAAVQAHLVNELGADIGAEAPKFQTFLPRVVDAVQQRFGNTIASSVLSKLIGGLRTALDTVRGLFGDAATESQNWVANIGDIHDTLAKMYAERFGSPVEREQAALGAMRDRSARDALVAGPQTAQEGVSEVAPPEAAPGTPEAAQAHDALVQHALTLRRWAGELTDEQRAAAAATPQATVLRQTEAAILRPVSGNEASLPAPQAARLEAVRSQLDAVTNPPDSPALTTVKGELTAAVAAARAARGPTPYAATPRGLRRAPDAVQLLAASGGIQPNADLLAMDADKINVPFVGKLVKPDGMSLNAARELLHEQGYPLEDPTDDRSVYQVIDEHVSGRPTYPGDAQAESLEYANVRAHNAQVDRMADESGIDPAGMTYGEFFDAVAHAAHAPTADDVAAGHEADYAEVARAVPGLADDNAPRSLEDMEREYRQAEAAGALGDAEEGVAGPEPAADRAGHGEAGAGLGVHGAGVGRGGEAARGGAEPPDVAFSPRPPRNVGGQGDIFRGEQPERAAREEREPTIRNDRRQVDMFGTADAAVQAQAARDQAVRGGINPRGAVKPADEGLFARREPKGPTLFSPRAGEPVSRITGEEIAPRSASLGALRHAARQFYQNVLRRTSVRSDALGRDVEFMSARKAFHTSANPDKLRLFAALRDVIAKGELVSSEAPRDPSIEPSTRAYHFLAAPVELAGKRVDVGVTVREDANGHLYYNHNPLEDAGGPGLRPAGTRRKGGPGSDGGTTHGQQVGAPGDDVNLQVTPTGEGGAKTLFSPRPGHERPAASGAEVQEADQLGRHEDDVSALINAVVAERGGIAGTAAAPTVEDRDLSRIAQLGTKATKNLNPLERSQTIFPRTLAALDDRFARYYGRFIARATEGNANAHDLRAVISDSLVKLPAASRDRVYAALELASKWNTRPANPELRVRVRNNSYWQAQHSKIGDDYILTAEETQAFHDTLNLGDAGWRTIMTALAKREGWRGEVDPAAIEAAAAKAGLHLPEGKRLMRLATALRAAQKHMRRAYFPAMRFGDIYLAVTRKVSPDLDTVSARLGRAVVEWFQTVERAAGRDLLGLRRTAPDQMQEVRDAIAALGKRNDNTGQPAFGAFKNTSPGVWESATHRIETGDLRRTPDALRQLNIPAIEKLFMLMERHTTAKVIDEVMAERTPEEGLAPKQAAELKRQTARYGSNFNLVGGEAYDRYQALLGATKDTLLDALYHDLLAGWKKPASLTPGYSGDFDRAIGTHIGQVSRNAADMVHREAIDGAYQDIQDNHPNESVRRYARDFQRDQDDPQSLLAHAAQSANQVGFVYALAANPASTLKIMLHTAMMSAPVMSVGVGMRRAATELSLALAEAYRNIAFDAQHGAQINVAALGRTPEEKAFIAGLDRAGLLHSIGADDVRGINDRQAGLWGAAAPLMRRAMDIASSNISVVDQANRSAVALAAHRIAQNKSALMLAAKPLMQHNALFRAEVANAAEEKMRGQIGAGQDMATAEAAAVRETYARFMLDQAAGQWGRANQAPAMRGTEGHLLFALHGFQTRYLSTMLALAKNSGPEGRVAAAWMIGGLAAVAGAYGLPFVQDIENGASAAWKVVAHVDPMIDAHLREWLGDAGFDKIGSEILLRGEAVDFVLRGGASALFGIDAPSAVGFGDIVTRSITPTDAFGTALSMLLGRLQAAYNRESTGQGAAAVAAELLPAALRNPAEAAVQARQGAISSGGEMEVPAGKISAADTAKRAIGFAPLDAAQARARSEYDYDLKQHDAELRQDIVRSVANLAVRASIADRSGDHAGADALRAQANRITTANQGLMITEQAYKNAEFEAMDPDMYRLTRAPMRVRGQVQNSPYP